MPMRLCCEWSIVFRRDDIIHKWVHFVPDVHFSPSQPGTNTTEPVSRTGCRAWLTGTLLGTCGSSNRDDAISKQGTNSSRMARRVSSQISSRTLNRGARRLDGGWRWIWCSMLGMHMFLTRSWGTCYLGNFMIMHVISLPGPRYVCPFSFSNVSGC